MKLARNGEFSMNQQEVSEFSLWLNDHPRERDKCFNEVVQSYINYKKNEYQFDERILEEA
jgi:hypothetical protein